jgi:hypothetical protein
MASTIYIKGKQKNIFDISFPDYQNFTIQKNDFNGKRLNYGQVQFLRFPYITSVISARRRREKVKRGNVRFYYEVKQPQFKLFG